MSIVYERVLRASLATLTTPPVYCEEPPPGITGEGLLQRRGGYNSWTELDLRAICAKDTPPSQQQQLQHQLPPQQQPPAEPCLPPLSPQHPSSSVEEGLAVCTRDGGGTIRDAMDIDQSNVCPYRLQHQETFHFIRLQTLPPPDDECVEVVRLFGYLERAGERLFGWASLTGRTVEDHDCILAITNMPAWMATHELRDVVAATQQPPQVPPDKPHFTQSKATKPPSTAASTPAILASTNCPLCDSIFPAGMTLSAREAHVNQCLVNMQGDVLSQNS